MNLERLLKRRDLIYGLLAIWIMIFHINRRLGEPIRVPVISQIILCGNIAVDIFLFFSGCCLYLSFSKYYDIKRFYKRRLTRVLPSYLFITIPFWFWRSLIEAPKIGGGFDFIRFFADLISATFWIKGVQTTWFVHAILVFYILFPLFFKIVNKGFKASLTLLLFSYFLNIIGINFFPIYGNSSIAWTRLPIYIIGIISGRNINWIDMERINVSIQKILRGGGNIGIDKRNNYLSYWNFIL